MQPAPAIVFPTARERQRSLPDKTRILIQLDTDPQPSVFDRVVAVDAGVEQLFSYGGVTPDTVRDHIYGAIFTRGPGDLHRSAIFIGGRDVTAGEAVLAEAQKAFLGKLRVSLMLDSSGANTTAAAAVNLASRSMDLAGARALVLGGTGSVGRRVGRLLAGAGASVRLGSRDRTRAAAACEAICAGGKGDGRKLTPVETSGDPELAAAMEGVQIVVAAGGPGAVLLPARQRLECPDLRVAVDLNAVPPLGIEGVEATDRGVERDGVLCTGALGVGGWKMKIHKAAVAALFEQNDHVLDAEQILAIARKLDSRT